MKANLHLHSRYSDGTLWPEELAEAAHAQGLDLAVLTDHDSLGGCAEFAAAAGNLGFATFPACEIDCNIAEIGYRSEILAYFPSGKCEATASLLGQILKARTERISRMAASAATSFGISNLSFETIAERKTTGRYPVPNPFALSYSLVDLFLCLKAEGAIETKLDYKAFLRQYIDTGKIHGSKMRKPSLEEIVSAVQADEGFLILPHIGHQFDDDPRRLEREEGRLLRLLSFFKKAGISGIELYWYGDTGKSQAINAIVQRAALDLGFILTFGSDCHGPGSGKHTIAEFAGDFFGFPVISP